MRSSRPEAPAFPRGMPSHTFRRRAAFGALVAALGAGLAFVGGCSEAGGPGATEASVRDSLGVAIVEHAAGALAGETESPSGWEADFDGALVLPGDFFQVAAAVRLDGGRIAVVERGDPRVGFFGPDGTRVGSVGGEGEGPGEFRSITSAHRWPGDSIVVFDGQLRRLTLFDSSGELGRTFAFEVTEGVPFASLQGVHAEEGSLLATGFTQTPPGGPEDGRRRYQTPAYRFGPDGTLAGVLPLATENESYFEVMENGFRVFQPLFPRFTRLLAGPDFLLEVTNDTWELRIHTPGGELTRVVRRQGAPARLTEPSRREAIERRLEEDGSLGDGEKFRRTLEAMPVPETLPAFSQVTIDRSGHIWVEDYDPARRPESAAWTVVDPEGMIAERIQLPRRFRPMEIGEDYLLGVLTDELEVERVVLAPLER